MAGLEKRFGELVYTIAGRMEKNGYFLGSQELGQYQKAFLRDVLQGALPKDKLPMALYNLTEVIAKLTKRKVVVLINEYDTPTSDSFQNGYFSDVCP